MTTANAGPALTTEQQRQAEEEGYVIIEGLLSPEQCQAYIARLDDYAHERRALPARMAIQREPRVARGEVAASRGEDIRKISGVAYGDDLFHRLVLHPRLVQIMQQVIGFHLKLFRLMC